MIIKGDLTVKKDLIVSGMGLFQGNLNVIKDRFLMTSAPLVYGGQDYAFDTLSSTNIGANYLLEKSSFIIIGITQATQPYLTSADGIKDIGVVLMTLDIGMLIYLTVYFNNSDFVGGTNPSPGTDDDDYVDTWLANASGIPLANITSDYFKKSMWTANGITSDYTFANPDSLTIVATYTSPPTLVYTADVPFFKVDTDTGVSTVISLVEAIPTLLTLDQNDTQQQMNFVSGIDGLIRATAGVLDVDTTPYIQGSDVTANETDPVFNAWLSATPPLYNISGQDLSTADNTTSAFITQGDIDWATNVPANETDPVFSAWLGATPPLYSDPYWQRVGTVLSPLTAGDKIHIPDYINFLDADNNTFIGLWTGRFVVSGAQNNTFIGYQAGFSDNALSTNAANNNTAVGTYSLSSNTIGAYNTAIGAFSLQANTEGTMNAAFGYNALKRNTTGSYNIAFGSYCLEYNTIGSINFGVGLQALGSNIDGSSNVAIGQESMLWNTSGSYNVAIGVFSLAGVNGETNISTHNVAIGYRAMLKNYGGLENIAIGTMALGNSLNANGNVAIGPYSLENSTDGWFNIAIGNYAMWKTTTGDDNAGIGRYALYNNTTGASNTGIGYYSLFSNETGVGNTAIGLESGINALGNYNNFIGYQADVATGAETISNAIAIGNQVKVGADYAQIFGGTNNVNSGIGAVILSGENNTINSNSDYSNILGGIGNTITGDNNYILGSGNTISSVDGITLIGDNVSITSPLNLPNPATVFGGYVRIGAYNEPAGTWNSNLVFDVLADMDSFAETTLSNANAGADATVDLLLNNNGTVFDAGRPTGFSHFVDFGFAGTNSGAFSTTNIAPPEPDVAYYYNDTGNIYLETGDDAHAIRMYPNFWDNPTYSVSFNPDMTTTFNGGIILNNTTTPSTPATGTIYFDGTHFQGWNGSAWKQLDN